MKLSFFGKDKVKSFAWLTGIFFIFYISGFKSIYVNYIISGGSVCLFAGYLFTNGKNFSRNVWRTSSFKLLVVFLLLEYYYLAIFGQDVAKFTMAQYIMFFPLIIYLYYGKDTKSLYGIFFILMAGWVIFACRAYYMYSNDIVSARRMASHMVDENVLIGGGYGFAVGSALLAVFMFEMLIWRNVKKHKFWVTVFVILLVLVVKETHSTLTILALAFGFAAAILFRMFGIRTVKKISLMHLILFIMIILFLLVFFLYKENVGMYILEKTRYAKDIVPMRIREIGVFLTNAESHKFEHSDMNDRILRIKSSWEIFIRNPLLGVTYKYGGNAQTLSYYGIGSHGEFTDLMAKYGLLGGIPYVLIIIKSILNERKCQKNKIGFGYIVTFLILFYFNPFMYFQSTTVLFFMLPTITYLFNSDFAEEK